MSRIVTVGTGLDSCRAALSLADAHQGVFAALGIDPHRAAMPDADRFPGLEELLAHPRAVAVGETGLDTVRPHATLSEQRRLLDRHLVLAEELDLPVVIHSREAEEETASALEPFKGTVVLHCFSSPGLVATALERGYFVSFAGNVTFPAATELREAAAAVPTDRLLVETDSPYLAPQPVRGRPNEPGFVVHIVAELAAVRGADPEALGRATHDNATAAFRLA